ncbi:MAG TPA: glycosyl hydrolase 115 family protein, partial [Sunxiuqinia sp.]|nr:glycosyl hydrolase 115 family protein [Sunxiuqinia sp.]
MKTKRTPMKKIKMISQLSRWLILSTTILWGSSCSASNDDGTFVISSPQITAEIVVHPNEKEFVHTAIDLFANDVMMVSDRKPEIKSMSDSPYQIKVGTLGKNPAFDKECTANGINLDGLKGKWEAYIIKILQKDGKHILYIVGSQPRGTAYGLMELSQRIGVSPWVWWDDVHPKKQTTLTLPGDLALQDGPKVQFRGIFINDEDWGLQPWAAKTFEPETGDIGPKTYAKVFELLLRLKANAIWPAMHPCTRAFFTYPGDIKMADRYGIFVGSSHAEPMLRNNVDEWHRWEPAEGKRGDWNFDTNPDQLKEYWRQRVDSTLNHDVIYTIGMRGVHDSGMPGGKTLDDKVQILDRVFDAQRKILEEESGRKDVSQIPQIFCPYKEVLKLYRMGAKVPDYAAIMWADDNNGYIRQLSDSA